MHTTPHLLDVVALLSDVPSYGLVRGQVGAVVELLDAHRGWRLPRAGRTRIPP